MSRASYVSMVSNSTTAFVPRKQCDQIWQHFAILITFYKPLGHLQRGYLVLEKFNLFGKFSLFKIAQC